MEKRNWPQIIFVLVLVLFFTAQLGIDVYAATSMERSKSQGDATVIRPGVKHMAPPNEACAVTASPRKVSNQQHKQDVKAQKETVKNARQDVKKQRADVIGVRKDLKQLRKERAQVKGPEKEAVKAQIQQTKQVLAREKEQLDFSKKMVQYQRQILNDIIDHPKTDYNVQTIIAGTNNWGIRVQKEDNKIIVVLGSSGTSSGTVRYVYDPKKHKVTSASYGGYSEYSLKGGKESYVSALNMMISGAKRALESQADPQARANIQKAIDVLEKGLSKL